MRTKYLFLLLMIGLLSCNSEKKSDKNQLKKAKKQEINLKISKPLKLSKDAFISIENWKEYKNFKTLFNQFENTTPGEALSNAKELNTLAQQLKDSIRNKMLNTIPFKARLDVLHNETLRLQDMVNIPNLKAPDIKAQVVKILAAYNATIAKLNNLAVQKQIEKELDNMVKDNVKDSTEVNNKKKPEFKPKAKKLLIKKNG